MSNKAEHLRLAEQHLSSAQSAMGLARLHTLAPGKCWTGFGHVLDAHDDIRKAVTEIKHVTPSTRKQRELHKEITQTAGRVYGITKTYKDRCIR